MISDPGGGDQNLVLTYWDGVPFEDGEVGEYLTLIQQLDQLVVPSPTKTSVLSKRSYDTSFSVALNKNRASPPILKRVKRRRLTFNY